MLKPEKQCLAGKRFVAHALCRRTFPLALLIVRICLGAAFLSGCFAPAQTIGTGSIQGTVFDASGAVLPNAIVTAVDPATGQTASQRTSKAGFYVLTSLPPAKYTITIRAEGFRTLVQSAVTVDALTVTGLDLHLEIGTVDQTVVVSSLPPQLDTSNGELEVTIPNSTYSALPLAMNGGPKSPMGFVTLLPGVVPGPILGNNLNGGPGQTSFLYINGMPVTTSELQGDTRNINTETSTEVIDQFQIITSGVPAYYQGQGITNFIMKSGTNRFHGDVYENIRNTVFDAAGYFATKTPVERQNEFGASVGGPILRDRAFFFFNYDGWRFTAGSNPSFYSIPTAAERNGDFSALPFAIYDPATTSCSASGVCTRQAFPNNIIPSSRLSSVSKALQSYLPSTINPSLQNNYANALTGGSQQNMYLGKVDLTVTKKNHLYFLSQYGNNTPVGLQANGGPQLPLPYTSSRYSSTKVILEQIGDTQIITDNLVNVFGYQLNRFSTPFVNPTTQGNYAAKAGLTGIPGGQASSNFPPVSFSGPNAPTSWAQRNYVISQSEVATTNIFQDNVQWIHGKHTLTLGGELVFQAENYATPSALDNVAFSNIETAGFDSAGGLLTTTGNSYASYLLGAVDSGNLTDTSVIETGGRYRNYSLYAQDDWKLSPKLTVNLGLRYEIPKPYYEDHNRGSWFNPTLPNPAVSNYPGALQFAGNGPDSCHCSTQVKTHYLTLGPRVGFAYSPTSRIVVRGSYTIMHFNAGALGGNALSQGTGITGYSATPFFGSPDGGITPGFNWDKGFPSYTPPPFFDPTLGTGYNTVTGPVGGALIYNRPDTAGRSPYTENWNLTLERQMTPSTVWSLSYAGSTSHFLSVQGGYGIYSDQLEPQYLKLGNLLFQSVTPAILAQAQAIMPGIKVPYANFSGSIGQMLRPFPQYGGLADPSADFGNAAYNSLQTYLQRTMTRGLYFLASYTWSKEMDNSGSNTLLFVSPTPRSAYNLGAERSVGAGQPAHVVSVAYVYELPFGRGHSFGGGSALMNTIVGGWKLSGLNQYSSGTPLGPIGAACNVPYMGGCYADYAPGFYGNPRINGSYGSGNPRGPVPSSYININAFQNPAAFSFGNTPRTAPYGLRNPWSLNESVALAKTFAMEKGISLKLQADAFNMFNRVVFGGINTSITSSAFGTVSGQANSPRNLQFEAYINF